MKQLMHTLSLCAPRRGLHEVTSNISDWLSQQQVQEGLLTVFIRHTSASLLIQENADPAVQQDLEAFLDRLVPEDQSLYSHASEGPDDMPAHIKGALTQTQLSIPVKDGQLMLGTWQGIYLFEHRSKPRTRELVLHISGN